jgi:hypothetical protein
LTIWARERDYPAYYRGTFGDDGDTLTGAWHFLEGGYEASRKILSEHPNGVARAYVLVYIETCWDN